MIRNINIFDIRHGVHMMRVREVMRGLQPEKKEHCQPEKKNRRTAPRPHVLDCCEWRSAAPRTKPCTTCLI